MNPKKPIDTLTWKKDNRYATIEKTLRQITTINKDTEKVAYTITQISEIPPITRKRKPKPKQKNSH